METLLSISIALCAGLLVSRFVKPLKMPAVTGYLIAGILIGPYCLGRLGISGLGFTAMTEVKALSLFNDVALGFIAFAIGNEFRLSQLRQAGRQATIIGIFQALAAALLVGGAVGFDNRNHGGSFLSYKQIIYRIMFWVLRTLCYRWCSCGQFRKYGK